MRPRRAFKGEISSRQLILWHALYQVMSTGYLALILHAHLPYVRHPEYSEFLEEDWLYEAITETYIPLLQVFHRLIEDKVSFKLTLSMTPPLCSMLRDPLLQERYIRYLDRSIALAQSEVKRTEADPKLNELAQFYLDRWTTCRASYVETWNCDLVSVFAKLQKDGFLEIITCAATHGFLPLMANYKEAVRAQILIARDHYRECFGCDPGGIWLPECGYVPGLDEFLAEANIRWFIMDSHGVMFGTPRPHYAIYAPVFTPSGVAAFARDRESSRQVWSAEEGYPGDPAYRDFYRDIGFDLAHDYIKPFLAADGVRKFTGVKYHRITGRGAQKDLYHRPWATAAVDANAQNFMISRAEQLEHLCKNTNIDPLILSPFDAELFGHWWFEGPEFLDLFIRKSVYDQSQFKLTTPGDYLTAHPTQQVIEPSASSWGHKGYWEVWLEESNAWIYPHLHAAVKRIVEVARFYEKKTPPLIDRALCQLARELLLAQSSDWAFLMKTGTARDYAVKKTKDHLLRFTRLYDQIRGDYVDEEFLKNCEWRDNIFQKINWRYYV